MKHILVTGSNGQLARCIQDVVSANKTMRFTFMTKEALSVTDKESIEEIFSTKQFDYCINTAAYTNVERAESDKDITFAINAEGAKNLADVCRKHDTTLFQISTDYVFDGATTVPYVETDATNPINVYGASKLKGENYVREHCKKHYIIRTSWLYSQYGHNFLKTMIKHGKAGTRLTITTEQTGTPTNANDLARAIVTMVQDDNNGYGLYHFSNEGEATWYDFATEIFSQTSELNSSNLAKTDHYRTFAQRPKYSVLNTTKIKETFKIQPFNWRESLKAVLHTLETN
ncbi:dTDP-4-dehydrorhamnose reductase [Rasiella rasia]|uniref:dTDP-4-dehydrorhamnose reductase n=1 Tax=Rasiella rasia TaxID=2744027 RepID=A0A6G6GNC4_9FLAO|nr:dTDP-4-dehydrorhamnose reductase [Rasiella rasia]QIE59913.1 dTDP-4-dehydrorhamnose reductase [Rasiella rasia]